MAKRKYKLNTVGTVTFQIENVKGHLPFTLGVKSTDGMMYPLVKDHTKLPVRYREVFTTAASYDLDTTFDLYMGERPFVADDIPVCSLTLSEGSFRMAGKPQYELNINIAPGGKMEIFVINKSVKNRCNAKIGYDSDVITAEQIAQVQADAKGKAEQDAHDRAAYEKMLAIDKRWNEIHEELWPVARRRIGVKNWRGYKKCHAELGAMLREGPAGMTDERMAALDAKVAEHEEWAKVLQAEYDKVMAWYEDRGKKKG